MIRASKWKGEVVGKMSVIEYLAATLGKQNVKDDGYVGSGLV
jgi:hypothetical protein